MGASCAKGSKTTDPDKTPYGKEKPTKKGSKKSRDGGGSRKATESDVTPASGPVEGSRTSRDGEGSPKAAAEGLIAISPSPTAVPSGPSEPELSPIENPVIEQKTVQPNTADNSVTEAKELAPRKRPPKKEYTYTTKTTFEVLQERINKAKQQGANEVTLTDVHIEEKVSDEGKKTALEIPSDSINQTRAVNMSLASQNSDNIESNSTGVERGPEAADDLSEQLNFDLNGGNQNSVPSGNDLKHQASENKSYSQVTEQRLVPDAAELHVGQTPLVDQVRSQTALVQPAPEISDLKAEGTLSTHLSTNRLGSNSNSDPTFGQNDIGAEKSNLHIDQKPSRVSQDSFSQESSEASVNNCNGTDSQKDTRMREELISAKREPAVDGKDSSTATADDVKSPRPTELPDLISTSVVGAPASGSTKFNVSHSQDSNFRLPSESVTGNFSSNKPKELTGNDAEKFLGPYTNGHELGTCEKSAALTSSATDAYAEQKLFSNLTEKSAVAPQRQDEERKPLPSRLPASTTSSSSSSKLPPVSSPSQSSKSPSVSSPSPSKSHHIFSPANISAVSCEEQVLAKNLLTDFTQENKMIIAQHHILPNTRTKLLTAVDQWLNSKEEQNSTRVMAVVGQQGVGKTCLAAELCRKYADQLIGLHFFHFNPFNPKHNMASEMLKSVAYNIGKTFPEYLQILAKASNLNKISKSVSVSELFEIIVKPLQTLHRIKLERMIIILDAVDECILSQREDLYSVLNKFNELTPNWLYLFVTLDSDNQSVSQLGNGIHQIEVKGTSEAMSSDLKRYFRDPMSPYIDRISLDGAQAQLMQLSQGSFLCASLLRKKLECLPPGTKLALRDVAVFPSGLSKLCAHSFQKLYNYISSKLPQSEAKDTYMAYVGILLLAREPIDNSAFTHLHSSLNVNDALAQLEGCVTVSTYNLVTLSHKSIAIWLLTADASSSHLIPNLGEAQQKMAEHIMVWLQPILVGTATYSVEHNLETYALKHCISHLTETSRQQENIKKILCSLDFLEQKSRVTQQDYKTLLQDYAHSHYQLQPDGSSKFICLNDYMKKSSALNNSIKPYREFLEKIGSHLIPGQILCQAANFPESPEIQKEALSRLKGQSWLHDFTNFSSTTCIKKQFDETVCDADISADGKYVTFLTVTKSDEAENFSLHIMGTNNLTSAMQVVDLRTIRDRTGYCTKILSDGINAFVGSLGAYIGLKTGKPVLTGFDLINIPVKEKYSVECCDSNANMLCCSITTLPFGGRALLMLIFDIKTKKFTKSLEILKFKFGGSPQFGTRACSLLSDGSMICAVVKQSSKCELKGMIWSTSNWSLLHLVQIGSDSLSKCTFMNNHTVLVSSGIRMLNCGDSKPSKSYIWSIDEESVKEMDERETSSTLHHKSGQVTHAQWFQFNQHARVSSWKKWSPGKAPDQQAMVYGLDGMLDVMEANELLIFVARNFVNIYKFSDLEKIYSQKTTDKFITTNVLVKDVVFIPRSDEMIITYQNIDSDDSRPTTVSVDMVRIKTNEFQVIKHLITEAKLMESTVGIVNRCFTNIYCCLGVCRLIHDSSHAVLCDGEEISVINISNSSRRSINHPEWLPTPIDRRCSLCVVSPKEPVIATVYSTRKEVICIHDTIKQNAKPLEFCLPNNSSDGNVTDLTFMPSTGHLLAYYSGDSNSFAVWNTRSGALISYEPLDEPLCYVAVSPASDRLTFSYSQDGSGVLLLRNADDSFSTAMALPEDSEWLPNRNHSDVEFTVDGTVVIGICSSSSIFRVWNAGNGEALKDINMDSITSEVGIIGMLTNTHAMLNNNNTLEVFDIGLGELVTALYVNETLTRKSNSQELKISSKGNFVAGFSQLGALKVFQCHNISTVKLKTTLQRMKSL